MRIIGMIHLKPLPGCPIFTSMEEVLKKALEDAFLLEKGGCDAILIENTYDRPQRIKAGEETIVAMTLIAKEIVNKVNIPVGINVLWNDYKAALAIAKLTGLKFVRICVFIEGVLANVGIIEGNPYDVISYRQKLGAKDIKILADVNIKHSTPLSKRPIEESAKEALMYQADEIVITGRYTGDMPLLDELRRVRKTCPNAIINVGSGTTLENIEKLAKYANNFIVGTYFKDAHDNIILEKVKKLTKKARDIAKTMRNN